MIFCYFICTFQLICFLPSALLCLHISLPPLPQSHPPAFPLPPTPISSSFLASFSAAPPSVHSLLFPTASHPFPFCLSFSLLPWVLQSWGEGHPETLLALPP